MKQFFRFLFEAAAGKNPVVFSFGRMNPPTTGHEKLVNTVLDTAKKYGAHHEIVLSHSHDNDKNPLTPEQKIKHAKRFFPGVNITSASKEAPTLMHHLTRLHKAGHDHAIIVAGGDRVEEYKNLVHKYNGAPSKSGVVPFHFKHITFVSAGERDPDSSDVAGMSASKMRAHVANSDYASFKKGVPAHVSEDHTRELFNDVKESLNKGKKSND